MLAFYGERAMETGASIGVALLITGRARVVL